LIKKNIDLEESLNLSEKQRKDENKKNQEKIEELEKTNHKLIESYGKEIENLQQNKNYLEGKIMKYLEKFIDFKNKIIVRIKQITNFKEIYEVLKDNVKKHILLQKQENKKFIEKLLNELNEFLSKNKANKEKLQNKMDYLNNLLENLKKTQKLEIEKLTDEKNRVSKESQEKSYILTEEQKKFSKEKKSLTLEINQRNQELEKAKDEISLMTNAKENLSKELDFIKNNWLLEKNELNNENFRKKQEIQQLSEEISMKKHKITQQEKISGKNSKESALKEEEMLKKQEEIANLNERLQKLSMKIKNMDKNIITKDNAIINFEIEIENYKKEIINYQKKVADLQKSNEINLPFFENEKLKKIQNEKLNEMPEKKWVIDDEDILFEIENNKDNQEIINEEAKKTINEENLQKQIEIKKEVAEETIKFEENPSNHIDKDKKEAEIQENPSKDLHPFNEHNEKSIELLNQEKWGNEEEKILLNIENNDENKEMIQVQGVLNEENNEKYKETFKENENIEFEEEKKIDEIQEINKEFDKKSRNELNLEKNYENNERDKAVDGEIIELDLKQSPIDLISPKDLVLFQHEELLLNTVIQDFYDKNKEIKTQKQDEIDEKNPENKDNSKENHLKVSSSQDVVGIEDFNLLNEGDFPQIKTNQPEKSIKIEQEEKLSPERLIFKLEDDNHPRSNHKSPVKNPPNLDSSYRSPPKEKNSSPTVEFEEKIGSPFKETSKKSVKLEKSFENIKDSPQKSSPLKNDKNKEDFSPICCLTKISNDIHSDYDNESHRESPKKTVNLEYSPEKKEKSLIREDTDLEVLEPMHELILNQIENDLKKTEKKQSPQENFDLINERKNPEENIEIVQNNENSFEKENKNALLQDQQEIHTPLLLEEPRNSSKPLISLPMPSEQTNLNNSIFSQDSPQIHGRNSQRSSPSSNKQRDLDNIIGNLSSPQQPNEDPEKAFVLELSDIKEVTHNISDFLTEKTEIERKKLKEFDGNEKREGFQIEEKVFKIEDYAKDKESDVNLKESPVNEKESAENKKEQFKEINKEISKKIVYEKNTDVIKEVEEENLWGIEDIMSDLKSISKPEIKLNYENILYSNNIPKNNNQRFEDNIAGTMEFSGDNFENSLKNLEIPSYSNLNRNEDYVFDELKFGKCETSKIVNSMDKSDLRSSKESCNEIGSNQNKRIFDEIPCLTRIESNESKKDNISLLLNMQANKKNVKKSQNLIINKDLLPINKNFKSTTNISNLGNLKMIFPFEVEKKKKDEINLEDILGNAMEKKK